MEFRDLNRQYQFLKTDIDAAVQSVLDSGQYILGPQVRELEEKLADYVGVKHCITCANGTDALSLAVMALGIGPGDAVFVPDFTFFSTGEIVSFSGATPIFVDVGEESFNISPESLEQAIKTVISDTDLTPRLIITVDLFGQPADYRKIRAIAQKYHLTILEDAAQGFGGAIGDQMACSFGDMAATSFFPSKPLGCYGDGGAVFTQDDSLAELIRSLRVHGKGTDKYDNVRIGMNSRLDTIQAAVLLVKLRAFVDYELHQIDETARRYRIHLEDLVKVPQIADSVRSSWAQYSVLLKSKEERDGLQKFLKEKNVPTRIYYPKPMHTQRAFDRAVCVKTSLSTTESICDRVLSLPLSPYMLVNEQNQVIQNIRNYLAQKNSFLRGKSW